MGYFNEFPHTRIYDGDLGWLIKIFKELQALYKSNSELLEDILNNISNVTEEQLNKWLQDGTLENMIMSLGNILRIYDTTTELLTADNLVENMVIITKGYSTVGDGLGETFITSSTSYPDFVYHQVGTLYLRPLFFDGILDVGGFYGTTVPEEINTIIPYLDGLYFRNAHYTVYNLQIPTNIKKIFGDSSQNTYLNINNINFEDDGVYYCDIHDLFFDKTAITSGINLFTGNLKYSKVHDVSIYRYDNAFNLTEPWGCTFENLNVYYCNRGMVFSSDEANNVLITNCDFYDITDIAIRTTGVRGMDIVYCIFERCETAISTNGLTRLMNIHDNYFEAVDTCVKHNMPLSKAKIDIANNYFILGSDSPDGSILNVATYSETNVDCGAVMIQDNYILNNSTAKPIKISIDVAGRLNTVTGISWLRNTFEGTVITTYFALFNYTGTNAFQRTDRPLFYTDLPLESGTGYTVLTLNNGHNAPVVSSNTNANFYYLRINATSSDTIVLPDTVNPHNTYYIAGTVRYSDSSQDPIIVVIKSTGISYQGLVLGKAVAKIVAQGVYASY